MCEGRENLNGKKPCETEMFGRKIRGAVFDVDGTLLDSMKIWEHAGERYLEKKGKTPETGLSDKLFQMSLEESAQYIKESYGISDSACRIVSDVLDMVAVFYREEVQLKTGISGILKEFRGRGIPMSIATSGDRALVEAAFHRIGILDYFSRIFTCTEVGAGKTQPDIFLRAAEYMGTAPEETVVFEDVLYAAQTAKKAGFCVVGIYDESSRDDAEEMRRICDMYLEKDSEFTEAFSDGRI